MLFPSGKVGLMNPLHMNCNKWSETAKKVCSVKFLPKSMACLYDILFIFTLDYIESINVYQKLYSHWVEVRSPEKQASMLLQILKYFKDGYGSDFGLPLF